MKRRLEPELMEDDEQARAYSEADFEEAHGRFVTLFSERFPSHRVDGTVLDLGCGPADVTLRFARAYPNCTMHGVDGSEAMLRYGRARLAGAADLRGRVELIHGLLPQADLPLRTYDVVVSNSLLHHLPEPRVMWESVRRYARPRGPVFVMDLMRPRNELEARELTERYAAEEPEVLKKDFYNSLLAAFEMSEVRMQLEAAGLGGLSVEAVSDRHLIVWGLAPAPATERA